MRFATAVHKNGNTFVGLINNDDEVIDIGELEGVIRGKHSLPNSLQKCIEENHDFGSLVSQLLEEAKGKVEHKNIIYPLQEVKLLAPIPTPRKNVFCIGKNYREHAIEMGSEKDIPTELIVFTKAPTTVNGHLDLIPSHQEITNQLDYEGELAIVIGKTGKAIKKEEAMDYIFGYTILNDITARDIQSKHKQFFLGKSLDGSCPIGPWIVHKSVIPKPQDLTIETKVNGEVRQSSSTKHLIFSIEEIIETLSKGMTLEAGDIIATGTPAGVGKGFKPPKFLKTGDVIDISIEKIGTLRNIVE